MKRLLILCLSLFSMCAFADDGVSLEEFKQLTQWPNKGRILSVLPLDNIGSRRVITASPFSKIGKIPRDLMTHPHAGVLWTYKKKKATYLSMSVRKADSWTTILDKVVSDYSPKYGGVSMLDTISIMPSPLGGYPDIAIFQTSVPAEDDPLLIPGPPMEQVFTYDKDSGEYP